MAGATASRVDPLGIVAVAISGLFLFDASGYLLAALRGQSFLHWPVYGIEPFLALAIGLAALMVRSRLGWVAVTASVLMFAVIMATDFVLSLMLGPGPIREQAQAAGDVRSVLSAQEAFARFNGGFYAGELECLGRWTRCFPDLEADEGAYEMLGQHLTRAGITAGYRRTFHAGPGATPQEISAAKRSDGGPLSPSSVSSYAYVAVRTRPFKAARNFCGDSSGVVCYTENAEIPAVEGGRCVPEGCTPVEAW